MKKIITTAVLIIVLLITMACASGKTVSEGIELSLDEINFSSSDIDHAVKLSATPVFIYAKALNNGEIIWESSDTSVVAVGESNSRGAYIITLKAGSASVTAKIKDTFYSRTLNLTVFPSSGTTLTLNPSAINETYMGFERTLSCILDNITIENSLVEFSSSAPDTVSVDKSGKIKVLKNGTATITAKYAGLTAICAVATNESSPRFWLSTDRIFLNVDQSYDIVSGITVDTDYVLETPTYYFNCNNASIVDISREGIATAKRAGTVTVYITNTFNNEVLYLAITVS